MPRAEAGTPKAIGKAIKAKGLQKLMFFCQVCQKQCRDANGFKCHTMSEAHQRQLLIVADNPGKFLEDYSREFLRDFMFLFRTRFGSKRVFANQVYQEYIKDRYHVHMNSTKWLSLSGFVQWLGSKGYATVDQTERGWYITYIDRNPETLLKEENAKKRHKLEKDYDERMADILEKQIARGKELESLKEQEKSKEKTEQEISEEKTKKEEEEKVLKREEGQKITFKLGMQPKKIVIKRINKPEPQQ